MFLNYPRLDFKKLKIFKIPFLKAIIVEKTIQIAIFLAE